MLKAIQIDRFNWVFIRVFKLQKYHYLFKSSKVDVGNLAQTGFDEPVLCLYQTKVLVGHFESRKGQPVPQVDL